MGVDTATALKQVSLMIHAPRLTRLGSWRRTAVLPVPGETGMGHAAAVRRGAWGAVTRRAPHRGENRTAVYTPAQRVVHAGASAQAGGSRDAALGPAHARLQAATAALGQAWADAAERRAAQHRPCAGAGGARGGRLRPLVTVCAIVVPVGAAPRRALGGRGVPEAAAPAGRLRLGRELAWQARGRGRCLDAIFRHRAPVVMAIAPHRLAGRAGPRGPARRGERGG